jgi:hypothetical protein
MAEGEAMNNAGRAKSIAVGRPRENSRRAAEASLDYAQVRPQGDLEQLGFLESIGKNQIFESRRVCLQAYKAEVEGNSNER